MSYDANDAPAQPVHIKVVGVGCAGCATVERILAVQSARGNADSALGTLTCIAVNTDSQALLCSSAAVKIRIGNKLTKGLGAGSNPTVGQGAAEESYEELRDALQGADLSFITAGMGGGAGTGAAPVVARIAQELGALTVGVVTRPFTFEGNRRRRIANEAIPTLKEKVDTLIPVLANRLLPLAESKMTMNMAFALADDVLCQCILGISDTIIVPGPMNLQFADVHAFMSGAGTAVLAVASASGADRASAASSQAIIDPVWEVPIEHPQGALVVVSGNDIADSEVETAATTIREAAAHDANILTGVSIDPSVGDSVRVMVISTGFMLGTGLLLVPSASAYDIPAVICGRRRML